MRLVDSARLEDALDEAIAGDIGRAGFCEAADQSEQDRASRKRDTAIRTANRAPASSRRAASATSASATWQRA